MLGPGQRSLQSIARETAARLLVIAMPSVHAALAAARRRRVRTHRRSVPHGAAPGRHARRALAAGRTEGSRDRGPARPQPGDAGLEGDPRLARRALGAGHRRRRVDRLRAVPPVRQARRAPRRHRRDRRTRAHHHRRRTAPRFPRPGLRAAARRLRRSGGDRARAATGRTGCGLPRRRLQAGAVARRPVARSGAQQRAVPPTPSRARATTTASARSC